MMEVWCERFEARSGWALVDIWLASIRNGPPRYKSHMNAGHSFHLPNSGHMGETGGDMRRSSVTFRAWGCWDVS